MVLVEAFVPTQPGSAAVVESAAIDGNDEVLTARSMKFS